MDSRPEVSLLDAARSGDPDALAVLYRRYAGDVYRTALRLLGSPAEAEDVLQDVFLGLANGLRTFEGRGSLQGWIRRVAARAALMRIRSQKRRVEVPLERVSIAPPVDRTNVPTDRVAIEEALAQLPTSQRVVLVLKDVEGYSYPEISSLLHISVGAAKARHHRAIKRMRRLLEQAP